MSAATWDQFVGVDGTPTPGHEVSTNGNDTVTLSSTTDLITTALINNSGSSRIVENYVLSSAADDFFRVNNPNEVNYRVDLSGGGSDFLILNDTRGAAFGFDNVAIIVTNFGSGAGGDVVQIQVANASISSGGFQGIAAADTNIAAGTSTVVYGSNLALMDNSWDAAEARTALDNALGAGTVAQGFYAITAYFGGGAYVMGVRVATADSFANAIIDLIGVLSNVGVNTLTSNNFS